MSFMHDDFTESDCIVDNDTIMGLIDWEMAGFFGWKTAGKSTVISEPPNESIS